jgi:DNA-binding NarL/FixJ family response regulator
VAGGDALLAPSVTRRLIDQFAHLQPARPNTAALEHITEREREVLALVARGLSNAEIAEQLVLSEGTVKTHVKHIFGKLDLRDRTHAVIFAYDAGLVEPRNR